MYNPILRWGASPSPSTTGYSIQWSRNSTPAGVQSVSTSTGSAFWSGANPSITLLAGDVVSASLTAVDSVNNLSSTPVVVNFTIPNSPPQPPINVSLGLT